MIKRTALAGFVLGGILATPPRSSATAPAATPPTAQSASLDNLVQRAQAAENHFDSTVALELFLQADQLQPNNAAILQKISRQYSDLATDAAATAEKLRLCTTALEYAQRAAALQPDNAVNVLSIAICYGKLALWSDIRTRVADSRLVREYAERALQLNPNYDYAHHVLGRWHYEVATLGATKRWLVRVVYGGLPAASPEEAVRHLQRAVELAPDLPAHRVELGFALLASGQRQAARETFTHALAMPAREKYDGEALRRAREALAGLGEGG